MAIREKIKEHLITSDVPTPPRQPSPKPHVLEDDHRTARKVNSECLPKQLDGADGQVWDEIATEFLCQQPETTVITTLVPSFPQAEQTTDPLNQVEVFELQEADNTLDKKDVTQNPSS